MFEPQKKIHQINQMEHGSARLDVISQAVKEADDESQHYWRLYFRYEYIKETTMHDDNFKSMLCFPEYLRIFDEHPEVQDDMYDDMMWAFKWLIGNLDDYYQISLEEVNHYFEEFKKRSQKYGFSLRTYYMKLVEFWLNVNPELAFQYYENFEKCPRNRNSDCEACELNFKMKVLLAKKEEEKALETIRPVLEHKKRCAEIPHVTYAYLAKFYLQQENFSEALYYANLSENLIRNKSEFLREIGLLLEVYSVLDVNAGWNLLKYSVELFMNTRNPMMKMLFSRGAYRLMKAVSKELDFVQSSLIGILPVDASENGWSSKELTDYFYQQAYEISEKLDKRNQTDSYVTALETSLPEYDEEKFQKEAKKSVHGLIHKTRTMLAVFSKQSITLEEMEQRIQNCDMEFISSSSDEKSCYVSLKAEENNLDCIIVPDIEPPEISTGLLHGMDEEKMQEILNSGNCCFFITEIVGNPLKAYQFIMRFLKKLFPEMCGVVNLSAQKVYSAEWVKFAGTYENAVSPYDLYSVYLEGDSEANEVWASTIGLNALGMRDLEFIGATTENFSAFAGMLDKTAAFCVERNTLPDENELILYCFREENQRMKNTKIFWINPETALKDLPPESVAVSMERGESPTGILNLHQLEDIEEWRIRISTNEKYRRIDLAEETFPLFKNALQKPFEKALVCFRIDLNEEMQDEYEYETELLWAEVNPDGKTAVFLEESEAVPEYHKGDSLEITQENTANWNIRPVGFEEMISPEEAYLLLEESA